MAAPVISNPFTFVLIPADESSPVVEIQASKDGGLNDDALIQHAKLYFYQLTGSKARAAASLEKAGTHERAQLAQQLRSQMIASTSTSTSTNNASSSSSSSSNTGMAERIAAMDDDAIIETLYKSHIQPSCDITALTIPTVGNGHLACSMYAAEESAQNHSNDDEGLTTTRKINSRATTLLVACGHAASTSIYGDVFCGRANDNEITDLWERCDFLAADVEPTAEWCRIARSPGGGGGSGGRTAASSLSNLLQQQQQQSVTNNNTLQVLNGTRNGGVSGGESSMSSSSFGLNGAPAVMESWGCWTQTADEVELKFAVAAGTKSKYCKLVFGRTALKVTVAGQTLVQGSTFDPIAMDDCTFTLEDTGPTNRELCVTLGKLESGRTWAFAVR